jgi:hypothetical protein
MKYRLATVSLVMTVLATGSAAAQSLAEVAKKEEARRKAIPTPAKVYTNESIRATPAPVAPAPAPTPAAATPSSAAPQASATAKPAAAAAGEGEGRKDEQHWRKRIQAERDALSRAEMFAEALQTRINVLSADFVARDDPAQRTVIGTDRQKALAELDRVKNEIAQHTKGIAGVQDEARRAGVPPGWLR